MILGIDLDGCAYPFVKNFTAYARQRGYEIPEDFVAKRWNFFEDLGLNIREFGDLIVEGIADEKVFIDLESDSDFPAPGFYTALTKLREDRHNIHIITHRSMKGAQTMTIRWLEFYGITFDALHFIEDKTVVKVDLLVEDSPINYERSIRANIPCIIFRQPYNEHLDATFLEDWSEFPGFVNRVSDGEMVWSETKFQEAR